LALLLLPRKLMVLLCHKICKTQKGKIKQKKNDPFLSEFE